MFTLVLAFLLQQAPELTSPLGKPLYPNAVAAGADDKAAQARNSGDAADILAAAKMYDDAWMFSKAIPLYRFGIEKHPMDFRFPRFLGHRYISLRQFDRGVTSLELARKQAPSSFDVAYHLGLAYYLHGDFSRAADAYARCLDMSGKVEVRGALPKEVRSCVELDGEENSRVAMMEWQYRALRRAGRDEEARKLLESVGEGMKVTTNESYYKTLLFYKGLRKQQDILPSQQADSGNTYSTIGYGVANFLMLEGRKQEACEMFRRIVEEKTWSAFGYIASETELVRGACK